MKRMLIAALAALSATAWAAEASAQDGRHDRGGWQGRGGDRDNGGGEGRWRGGGGEGRWRGGGGGGDGQPQQQPQAQPQPQPPPQPPQPNGGGRQWGGQGQQSQPNYAERFRERMNRDAGERFRRSGGDGGGQLSGGPGRADGRPTWRPDQQQGGPAPQQPQQPAWNGGGDRGRNWNNGGPQQQPGQAFNGGGDRRWNGDRGGDRNWSDNNRGGGDPRWNGGRGGDRNWSDNNRGGGGDQRWKGDRGGDRNWSDNNRRGDDRRWSGGRDDGRWAGNDNRWSGRRFDGGDWRRYDGSHGWDRRWSDWRRIPRGGYFNRDYAYRLSNYWGGRYYWWSYSGWHRPYRRYVVGYILPEYLWEPVPYEIYDYLPPPPYGCDYVMVDRDILLISLSSMLIIDALVLSDY